MTISWNGDLWGSFWEDGLPLAKNRRKAFLPLDHSKPIVLLTHQHLPASIISHLISSCEHCGVNSTPQILSLHATLTPWQPWMSLQCFLERRIVLIFVVVPQSTNSCFFPVPPWFLLLSRGLSRLPAFKLHFPNLRPHCSILVSENIACSHGSFSLLLPCCSFLLPVHKVLVEVCVSEGFQQG